MRAILDKYRSHLFVIVLFIQKFHHQIRPICNDPIHTPFDILLHQFGVVYRPRLDPDILGMHLSDEALGHNINAQRFGRIIRRLDRLAVGHDESAQEDLAEQNKIPHLRA